MRVLLLMSCLLGASAVMATDFTPYEGKNTVQEGEGGEKKTVDGIDFWSNGAPPRKFKLLGYITDKRLKTGLVGMMKMKGLEGSIAKKAKEVGGDAVILVGAETETTGYVGNTNTNGNATATTSGNRTRVQGTTYGNTTTAAVQKQHSRYAVVQYVDEDKVGDEVPKEAKPSEN